MQSYHIFTEVYDHHFQEKWNERMRGRVDLIFK
jgi:hypothetical protein